MFSCVRFRTSREGTPESPTMRTRTWPKGPTPFWSRLLPLLLRLPLSFQNIAAAAAARTRRRRQKAPAVRSPYQASTRPTLIGAIRCDGKGGNGTSAVEGRGGEGRGGVEGSGTDNGGRDSLAEDVNLISFFCLSFQADCTLRVRLTRNKICCALDPNNEWHMIPLIVNRDFCARPID